MGEGRGTRNGQPTLDELQAFVQLARELHFGHAARSLDVARSSLSEAIRRLESKLGTVLFERSTRRVVLTAAGGRMLPRARGIVAGMAGLQRRLDGAAAPIEGVIRIGIEGNGFAELTSPILGAWRRLQPTTVTMLRDFDGVPQSFFDAHLDVALARSPLQDERLEVVPVTFERRGLLVGTHHSHAGTSGGSIVEFLDDSFVALDPSMRAYWLAEDHRGGERPRIGGEAFSVTEILHAVSHLGLVTTAGESIPRFFPFPGVAFAAVTDLTPVVLSVATRAGEARPDVTRFVDIVRQMVRHRDAAVPPRECARRVGATRGGNARHVIGRLRRPIRARTLPSRDSRSSVFVVFATRA